MGAGQRAEVSHISHMKGRAGFRSLPSSVGPGTLTHRTNKLSGSYSSHSNSTYLACVVFVRTVVGPRGEGQLAPESAGLLAVFEQPDHHLGQVAELTHIVQQLEAIRGEGTRVTLPEKRGRWRERKEGEE